MSDLNELRQRFPHWTIIRQDPDPECYACKGSGVLKDAPCMCAVFSEPHGESKREFMREFGRAAGRLKKRMLEGDTPMIDTTSWGVNSRS